MKSVKLNVNGMSCEHCVKSIKNGLLEIEGISDVQVSLANKNVDVDYSETVIGIVEIKKIIEEIGYEVV